MSVSDRCQSWGHERSSALQYLCEELRALPEIKQKQAIRHAAQLRSPALTMLEKYAQPGDDCAAFQCGDGYQLLAMEGMQQNFVAMDARAAGWSSVMVNVSDIAAMGGRPTAVVNALWHNNDEKAAEILFHIKRACDVFGVHFSGGHSTVNNTCTPNLALGISGFASKLLSCYHLKPGQRLFMLTDLDGSWHGDLPYWGCVLGKSPEALRKQWNIPAELAEEELTVAAKDISNGGILGTLIMMLELNGCGAKIDLNAIPKPKGADLTRWLRAFLSYGFLLAVNNDKVGALIHYFKGSKLVCAPIGSVTDNGKIILDAAGATEEFWDVRCEPLTYLGA